MSRSGDRLHLTYVSVVESRPVFQRSTASANDDYVIQARLPFNAVAKSEGLIYLSMNLLNLVKS